MASGGSSDREDRIKRRNMNKELEKLQEQRQMLVDQIRKESKIGQGVDTKTVEKSDIDKQKMEISKTERDKSIRSEDQGKVDRSRIELRDKAGSLNTSLSSTGSRKKQSKEKERKDDESEMFKRLDSSLKVLRRKMSYLESTRVKTHGRTGDKSDDDESKVNMTSTDKEKEEKQEVMSGSKLDDEIAELSKKRHEIEQSNVEREMKLKEATLEKRLKEIEERERKDNKELEMMKAILHERELEISNREVMMKRKETEWEEKLIARDRDMKIYEQRLKDMERTMIERFDSLEKDIKLRESMTEEKEADVRRREESLERKIHERKEEIFDINTSLKAEGLSMKEGQLNSGTRGVDMKQKETSTGLKEIELKCKDVERIEEKTMPKDNNESSEQKGKELSESEQALHDLDKQIRELQVKKELLYSKSKDELNTERKEYKEGDSKDKIKREETEVAKSKDDTKYTSTLESVKDNLNVKLNLTQYSGAELRPRNEATFEEWKMEVESVQATYSEIVVMQAIRKSLKGQAKRIMLHLGPNTTVEEVLLKMEDAFGNVASKDSILSRFFMAEQEENETVVEWGLRLEDMLLQASRKAEITKVEKQEMLKKRFWRGLRNEQLRNATRVHFESTTGFEELRNRVRSEEYEIKVEKERSGSKQKQGAIPKARQYRQNIDKDECQERDDSENVLQKLIEKMEMLDKKVEDLKKENETRRSEGDRDRRSDYAYRYNRGQPRGQRPYRGRFNRGRGRDNGQREQHNNGQDQSENKQQPLNK
ncbi:rootletin-like [Mercenaria mercenaria]|uniref:rootletin-like n=1 Tax=Mercenaria mercenaria TaxID=6596 RepID=UPI00234E9600|nr:rootletin-like [Mercenaria mercenaria]